MPESPIRNKIDGIKFAIGATAIGIITLAVYIITLCPTVYVGDSGELTAASWTMGIPHSPGYPLYTFLGYFFSHLPFGDNPAVRMNFMTALFGALSIVLLFRLASLLTGEFFFSFLAALIFAFSTTSWSQSLTAEVYTLNNLVVGVAVVYIILASTHNRKRYLYLAAFFSGLSLTTHQTSLFLLPASLWLLIRTGSLSFKKSLSTWIKVILLYILGFAFYLYLPIASSQKPEMNWGNPSTISNFVHMLFSPAFTQVNEGAFKDHFIYFFEMLFREFNYFGAVLAVIGLIASLSKNDLKNRTIALIILTYIILFLIALRPVFINLYKLDVYYLPVFMLLSTQIVVGGRYIIDSLEKRALFSKNLFMPVITVALLLALGWNIAINWDRVDKSENRLAEWYGTELLDSCDQNAILLCNFDDLFILFYLQKVMDVRPDVRVVLAHFPTRGEKAFWKRWHYDELTKDTSLKTGLSEKKFFVSSKVEDIIETFIDENIKLRPIFISFYNIPPLEFKEMDYRFEPVSLAYRASKAGQNIDNLNWNYEYFKTKYRVDFFKELFAKHHNFEEDFILVRYDSIFRFNAALFSELDQSEKSLYFMELATAVNPLSPDNWAFRARLEESLGKINESINSIEEIIKFEESISREISPIILDWRYEQAKIYHRAGRNLEAADILNKYYKYDQRKPESIKQLAKEIENALKELDEE